MPVIKQITLSILLLYISIVLDGQMTLKAPPKKPYTTKQVLIEQKNHSCLQLNKFTARERLKYYPFNKATSIKIVSYDVKDDSANSKNIILGNELPIHHGDIDYTKIDEVKILSRSQIDSLTNIIYNVGYRGPVNSISKSMCFTPRNAILFQDRSGKTFEYIEICFECERFEASSESVTLGEMCDQKFNILKSYLIDLGIEIGTLKWNGKESD